jgi:hypothetical protein
MGYAPRALLAGGLGFAVSFLVACGGGANLLSGGEASNLNSRLDSISSAVDSGQCGAAANGVSGFGNDVANLHATVSPTLRRNLLQGISTVAKLAGHDCRTTSSTTTSSTTTSSSTTSTTTSTSTSSSTSTTTSTPTSTTTSSATTTTGSGTTSTGGSGGAGLGGGAGGGNGNGGNGQ